MFIFFVVAARLFLVFASIHLLCCWSAHKSLAPRTRILLGVLGQATLIFVAVATLLFFFFCECPKFCDLAKQRRKTFVGVSEVGKIDFALYFFLVVRIFLVFFFFCCDRASAETKRILDSLKFCQLMGCPDALVHRAKRDLLIQLCIPSLRESLELMPSDRLTQTSSEA